MMKRSHVFGWMLAMLLLGFIAGRYRVERPTRAGSFDEAVRTDFESGMISVETLVVDLPKDSGGTLAGMVDGLSEKAGVLISCDEAAFREAGISLDASARSTVEAGDLRHVLAAFKIDGRPVPLKIYRNAGDRDWGEGESGTWVVGPLSLWTEHRISTRAYDLRLPMKRLLRTDAEYERIIGAISDDSRPDVVPRADRHWSDAMNAIVVVVNEAVFGELAGANSQNSRGLVVFVNGWMVIRGTARDHRRAEMIIDRISGGKEVTTHR